MSTAEARKQLGQWLHQKREEIGISQDELGAQVAKTQSCIAKIERGQRKIETTEFFQICAALGVKKEAVLALYSDFFKKNSHSIWSES